MGGRSSCSGRRRVPGVKRDASALIDTEWEPLPMASDVASAKTDEVLVHPGSSTNTYHTLQIRKATQLKVWRLLT